jgi:hypothetical protein
MKLIVFISLICFFSLIFTMNHTSLKRTQSPDLSTPQKQANKQLTDQLKQLIDDTRFINDGITFLTSKALFTEFPSLLIPFSQNPTLQIELMKEKQCTLAYLLQQISESNQVQQDKYSVLYDINDKKTFINNDNDNIHIVLNNIQNEKQGQLFWAHFLKLAELINHGFLYTPDSHGITIDGQYYRTQLPFLQTPLNITSSQDALSSHPSFAKTSLSLILVPCALYGIYSFIKTYFLTK